jgi:hypothetical protein
MASKNGGEKIIRVSLSVKQKFELIQKLELGISVSSMWENFGV